MRWEGLFEDLSGQWEAEERRELDLEVADRTRRERATLGLRERLAAAGRTTVRVTLTTAGVVDGRVVDVGEDWLLLEGARGVVLLPVLAVAGVVGLGPGADTAAAGRRFGLGYALRGLSRDRAVVAVHDVSGAVHTGTIDAVGRDAFELTEHAADLPRRTENVTGHRLVPFSALLLVRPAT